MWSSLFVSLLLAHFVGDYLLQSGPLCKQKREKKVRSWFQYVHALIIAILSWVAIWDIDLWYVALAIGLLHLIFDIGKSYVKEENVWTFVLDQVLHILVMAVAAWVCVHRLGWSDPAWLTPPVMWAEAIAVAGIICWRPANFLIRSVLQYNRVAIPSDPNTFHAGQLIGILERWLILVFILIGHYEVIGFLIAAKSIIRFGDHDRDKTEYFLAGTLLSIAIAVGCGLLVLMVFKA
jgi:hypothetical protein